eukprot:352561-Chlamydomonas_euryale.AAC.15
MYCYLYYQSQNNRLFPFKSRAIKGRSLTHPLTATSAALGMGHSLQAMWGVNGAPPATGGPTPKACPAKTKHSTL